jgi:hypothetical protein
MEGKDFLYALRCFSNENPMILAPLGSLQFAVSIYFGSPSQCSLDQHIHEVDPQLIAHIIIL